MGSLEDSSLWSAPSHFTDGWFWKAHPLSNCKYLSNICTNLSKIDVLHIAQLIGSFFFFRFLERLTFSSEILISCNKSHTMYGPWNPICTFEEEEKTLLFTESNVSFAFIFYVGFGLSYQMYQSDNFCGQLRLISWWSWCCYIVLY